MKRCTVCKEEKDYSHYHCSKVTKDKYGYRCISCDRAARADYRERNYERFLEVGRRKQLKHKYGLSPEQYEEILQQQLHSCALCTRHVSENNGPVAKNGSQRLAVDHDHETGRVRGLLCNNCNRALGLFQDNADLLRKAAKYIDR